jgi:hypothetical protein
MNSNFYDVKFNNLKGSTIRLRRVDNGSIKVMKQNNNGKRLKSISTSSVDSKKFGRKELEEACRKLTPRNEIAIGKKRQRVKQHQGPMVQKDSDAQSQVKSLDVGVKICARKYNECKAQADRLEKELNKKKDERIELEQESRVLEDMIKGNNTEAKKIAKLSDEIAEANLTSESKLRYRHKLHHMHQRQRKNSFTVDAHMSEMALTLSAAEREEIMCKKMLHEIESGMTNALHDLEKSTNEINSEHEDRQQRLNSKKNEVDNAERLEEWRRVQEVNRKNFELALGGAHQVKKENRLEEIKEREHELKVISKATEAKNSGKGSSEEAFMRIKRATGVNSVKEMVDKLTNHQEVRNRLQNEKNEAEDKLNGIKSSLQSSRNQFDEMKANGFGDTELSREIIDGISDNIMKERSEGKVMKSTNERLESVLVALRQGGIGLYHRLLPFHQTLLGGDAPTLHESATACAIQAANDTLEMLKIAQQILDKMLVAVGGLGKVKKSRGTMQDSSRKQSLSKFENPNLVDNNCRIRAKVWTIRDGTYFFHLKMIRMNILVFLIISF